MYMEQALAGRQVPEIFANGHPWTPVAHRSEGVLGQEFLSSALRFGPRRVFTLGRSRLEELKRRRFTPEGKAERVARALAALYQEESIKLSPEEWRWIAEDPDLEDQF